MYKQLSEIERTYIETSLNQNIPIKDIATSLYRAESTILREIRRNRVLSEYKFVGNQCSNKFNCKNRHVCGDKNCFNRCYQCHFCNDACAYFSAIPCKTRDSAPFSCNACKKKSKCHLDKYFYLSSKAQKYSYERLSESRRVIRMSPDELTILSKTIKDGLSKKQPIYHIITSSDLSVSQATVYRYIDNGTIESKNIDLPKKPGWKLKTGRRIPSNTIPGYRVNKTYSDYQDFITMHPEYEVVQMDLVEGSGKKIFSLSLLPKVGS